MKCCLPAFVDDVSAFREKFSLYQHRLGASDLTHFPILRSRVSVSYSCHQTSCSWQCHGPGCPPVETEPSRWLPLNCGTASRLELHSPLDSLRLSEKLTSSRWRSVPARPLDRLLSLSIFFCLFCPFSNFVFKLRFYYSLRYYFAVVFIVIYYCFCV